MNDIKATAPRRQVVASQWLRAASNKLDDGPEEPSPGYTDPSVGLSAALVTLAEMIATVSRDVGSLEAAIRSHMPNHLYEDKDCESKANGYFESAARSSPAHAAVVEGLNDLHSISERIQHIRAYVVA